MRFWYPVLLAFLPAIFASEIPEEYITAAEASKLQENGETVVIAFSTKHCPHCQRFGQLLGNYREAFKTSEVDARIHKLDTQDDENKEFVKKFDIQGVPTVYVFVGKQDEIKYEGSREVTDLTNFVKRVQNLKTEVLISAEDISNFKSTTPALLVVVSNPEEKLAVIESAAKDNIEVAIAYTSADLAKDLGLSEGLHMFREDGETVLAEIPKELYKLNAWIKVAALRTISTFPSAAREIFSSGIHDILFLIDEDGAIASNKWVKNIAEEYRGKVVFAVIDLKDEESAHALDFFSVKKDAKGPIIKMFNDERRKQYWMHEDVTNVSVLLWLEKYFNDELSAHMRSEDVSEDWNSKPLTVLVGSNFEEIVFDKEKSVFVMFHAPWCHHCKKLMPDFEKLADYFADNTNVIIAKLDATANDIDDGKGDIQGFPTLRLYKAGDNSIAEYSGNRAYEDLLKFVEEQTSENDVKEDHDEL